MASRILNPTEFADVVVLVHDLVARTRVDPDHLLLIGARCRDALHRALGHGTAVRGTDDIDLGIAVESLSDYRKVVETLEPTGTTGARFKVHGLNVDIMPFGPIEDPRGTVTLGSRFGEFSVEGFTSVWTNAQTVQLGDFASIRVPRVAGYAVLKAHAYAERAARFETKDAEDFATILTWYRSSDVIVDEVYNTDFGINVLQEKAEMAARGVLAHDVGDAGFES